VSDIDTAVVDSLKVLDPKRPIREADIVGQASEVRFEPRWGLRQFEQLVAAEARRSSQHGLAFSDGRSMHGPR